MSAADDPTYGDGWGRGEVVYAVDTDYGRLRQEHQWPRAASGYEARELKRSNRLAVKAGLPLIEMMSGVYQP
eukprot:2938486-Amphidinium_carterae.1